MDHIIPWKEFNETLAELDRFRKDYSEESAMLISEVKKFIMDGMDAYFSASQDVYEWTGRASSHLTLYIKLFDNFNGRRADAQKQLLVEVLGAGVDRMNAAQKQLKTSSARFNLAFGKLSVLRKRFEDEFNEKSEFVESKVDSVRKACLAGDIASLFGGVFGIPIRAVTGLIEKEFIPQLLEKMESVKKFYDNLNEKVHSASENTQKTKALLKNEIQHIGELRIQTQQTESFVSFMGLDRIEIMEILAQNLVFYCVIGQYTSY